MVLEIKIVTSLLVTIYQALYALQAAMLLFKKDPSCFLQQGNAC